MFVPTPAKATYLDVQIAAPLDIENTNSHESFREIIYVLSISYNNIKLAIYPPENATKDFDSFVSD